EIRKLFGHQRTLPIGAAFGVITVLGSRVQGQIEVATFRKDAGYSDGRHPDSVSFSSAEEDAQRRDFTINGLFFNPLTNEVLDYVGGQADLERQVLRAIGDPHERLAEDKLRMLRAIRFAASYGFKLDEETKAAVTEHADEIGIVSVERISAELRRMLIHRRRKLAVQLLQETNLLTTILPEFSSELIAVYWSETLAALELLETPTFATSFALLLRPVCEAAEDPTAKLEQIGRRLKLSNDEIASLVFQLRHYQLILSGEAGDWPVLQRVLIDDRVSELVTFCRALSKQLGRGAEGVQFSEKKLALKSTELNPPRLLDGNDLRDAGIPAGPHYKDLLKSIRDEQLMGRLDSAEAALAFAKGYWDKLATSDE
ncbi:MAG: tRNA nucleotidyltransferase/poly(A) polymerase, partial [Pirellulaceae bacterium]